MHRRVLYNNSVADDVTEQQQVYRLRLQIGPRYKVQQSLFMHVYRILSNNV